MATTLTQGIKNSTTAKFAVAGGQDRFRGRRRRLNQTSNVHQDVNSLSSEVYSHCNRGVLDITEQRCPVCMKCRPLKRNRTGKAGSVVGDKGSFNFRVFLKLGDS